MTGADYPDLRVVEIPKDCTALVRLPELPVRMLVLAAPSVDPPDRRPLPTRLRRIAESLGVGEAVVLDHHPFTDWMNPLQGLDPMRYDAVFLRPDVVPPEDEDPLAPDPGAVASLAQALVDLETRFWVLEPGGDGGKESTVVAERLARSIVEGGGPPAILPPADWDWGKRVAFYEEFVERILHDATIDRAATEASIGKGSAPSLIIPAGRRHGLDLARLLEDLRRRLDEGDSAVRSLQMEIDAAPVVNGGLEVLDGLGRDNTERVHQLRKVRGSCDEIHRDRDPASWSRLADSLDGLTKLEEAVGRDRDLLDRLRRADVPAEAGE